MLSHSFSFDIFSENNGHSLLISVFLADNGSGTVQLAIKSYER